MRVQSAGKKPKVGRGGPAREVPSTINQFHAASSVGRSTAAPSSVKQLFEALISRIGSEERAHHDTFPQDRSRETPQTLFELSIDGARYLLQREAVPEVIPEPPPPAGAAPCELAFALSPREYEIAGMIARGHPNKTIATVLEISCWTVGTHIRRIFAKLGVASRAAMIAQLMKQGWSDEISAAPLPRHAAPPLHPPMSAPSVRHDEVPLRRPTYIADGAALPRRPLQSLRAKG
jgi:DNA-binding CsgD family transcriptional regulator